MFAISHKHTHSHTNMNLVASFSIYTLNTECLFFVVFGVDTPITASLPSRSGANKCVFPGVTTMVWIGICNGISKTGFSLSAAVKLRASVNWSIWIGFSVCEHQCNRSKQKKKEKKTKNEQI